MQEVEPKLIPPPTKEPLLKVGIVLKEDKKASITFRALQANTEIKCGERKISLLTNTPYRISLHGNTIEVSTERQRQLLVGAAPFNIIEAANSTLLPQSGLLIEGVVAGRCFHWRKEIDQTLPGNFEVHAQDGCLVLVNQVKFEDYIACVISSEMSKACPAEFAKSQAVAARSWAYVFLNDKHKSLPFTICNDDDCQRYQGTTHSSAETLKAALECRGEFLSTPQGHVCPAYYSKSCGGHTEDPLEIFGFKVPGLAALADAPAKPPNKPFCSPAFIPEENLKKYLGAVDEQGRYYRWNYSLSPDILINNLKTKFGIEGIQEILSLTPETRSKGKRITRLRIIYRGVKGLDKEFIVQDQYDIRRALHPSFLYSSAFELKIHREKSSKISTIELSGGGWGHGVGLCQIGALGMALSGQSHRQILKHYFPVCEVITAY